MLNKHFSHFLTFSNLTPFVFNTDQLCVDSIWWSQNPKGPMSFWISRKVMSKATWSSIPSFNMTPYSCLFVQAYLEPSATISCNPQCNLQNSMFLSSQRRTLLKIPWDTLRTKNPHVIPCGWIIMPITKEDLDNYVITTTLPQWLKGSCPLRGGRGRIYAAWPLRLRHKAAV